MPAVMTIDGPKGGGRCKRVRMGKAGCTIETCRGSNGRWKFQKGTKRCGR